MMTYFESSIGSFDLDQYASEVAWKRYFGTFMHIAVLLFNLVLMLNLLIAIMSDTYAALSAQRIGLYQSSLIREMPKFSYDSRYGVLSMTWYPFSWLALLVMPFLLIAKDKKTLKAINTVYINVIYLPVSLLALSIFMVVNLVLIPFAYLKTALHKLLLLVRLKSTVYCQELVVWVLAGVPILLVAQVADAFRFMVHTYSKN